MECVGELQEGLEGWGELVLSGGMSELVFLSRVQQLVCQGYGERAAEESPAFRDGEGGKGGAGHGRALARCRFCEPGISGDK